MATTIVSAAGAAIGGPAGEALGSFAGKALDRAIDGSPSAAALRVQSAAYGEAAPRLYGTLRVSGSVLWATGLKEEGAFAQKLSGGSRTFSTSVAIGLSARPILGVGRIWADGRLIRDASGDMSIAGAVRVHLGAEDQTADPLIVAAEGVAGAPAYRGLAYAVLENLQLGEFGNRVPTIAFEVIADDAPPTLGAIAADLVEAAGAPPADVALLDRTLAGYGVGGAATLGGALSQLALFQPHEAIADASRLRLAKTGASAVSSILGAEAGTRASAEARVSRLWRAEPAQRQATRIEATYFDPERDYQPGWQSATPLGSTRAVRRYDLPASLAAGDARALAERLARDAETARATRTIDLPYARANFEVGDMLALEGDARVWRVARQALAEMTVSLDLEAWEGASAARAATDAGRSLPNPLSLQGPTRLDILDLPDWSGEAGSSAVLWLAVSGGPNWRAAEIVASVDAGASWRSLGVARARAVTGTTVGVLADGPCDRWDERTRLEVVLTNPDDWLTTASADAVLGGANIAWVGGELVQYRAVEALGAGRFRLSGLLRGRFGTEFAAVGHLPGEPYVVLERDRLLRHEVGSIPLGVMLALKAIGPTETAAMVEAASIRLAGNSLRPFAPVRLRVARDGDGTIRASWTRRSRVGLGWPDSSDTALGEEREQYLLTLASVSGVTHTYGPTSETMAIGPSEQLAQFGAPIAAGTLAVAQLSSLYGAGPAASVNF